MSSDLVNQLARAVHEGYLAEQERHGVGWGSTPSMVAWEDLSEDLQEANRAQARDIAPKLASAGFDIVSARQGLAPFAFTEAEIEDLARREHERWMSQRVEAGWSYGVVRDDGARRHPALVPWVLLPEGERDKDRAAVRHIPVLLAIAGLTVVRREAPWTSR